LIVDDDPDFVSIASSILSYGGHEVLEASSAREALEIAKREVPHIVLLDIMMDSALDGLHLSHEVRAEPTLRKTRVIMVSSIAASENAQLFPTDEYLPADAWLSKPVEPAKLLKTVGEYCHPDLV